MEAGRGEGNGRLGTEAEMCEEEPEVGGGGGVLLHRDGSACFIPAMRC